MMNRLDFSSVELLAPGGSRLAIENAAKYGADAVYFGVDSLNARSGAENIRVDDLNEIMKLLHRRAVKGYLALNVLMTDKDLIDAEKIVEAARQAAVDAVIVQDFGLADIIRRKFPEIALHASTQMTITDEYGIKKAASSGISRVVLPRELNISTISRLTAYASKINVETEVFVHGALCIAYSGQCLMSGLKNDRSANRGQCSQPCRLSYKIEELDESSDYRKKEDKQTGFGQLLSPKDQSLIKYLSELIETGVSSLKIEGRMRSPEYTALTVSEYRRILDQLNERKHNSDPDERLLMLAFNRGGSFTDRYYKNDRKSDFLTGGYPGSHGIRLGEVVQTVPEKGILEIVLDKVKTVQLSRGDVLSVRTAEADREIASAPAGVLEYRSNLLLVKAFHPDVLRKIRPGNSVFQMSDLKMLEQVYKTKERKLPLFMKLIITDTNTNYDQDFSELSSEAKLADRQTATLEMSLLLNGQRVISINHQVVLANSDFKLPVERIRQQLAKTGGTQFIASEIIIDDKTIHGTAMTVAQVNQLRRDAVIMLQQKMHYLNLDSAEMIQSADKMHSAEFASSDFSHQEILAEADDKLQRIDIWYQRLPDEKSEIACGADNYILPLWSFDEKAGSDCVQAIRTTEPDSKIYVWLPPAPQNEISEWLKRTIKLLPAMGIDGVCGSHPAVSDLVETGNHKLKFQIDSGYNVTNQRSLKLALSCNPEAIAFSAEMTIAQILKICSDSDLSAAMKTTWMTLPVYGRQRLMSSAFCPVGHSKPDCRKCYNYQTSDKPDNARLYSFIDQQGRRFVLQTHPRFCTMDLLDNRLLIDHDMLRKGHIHKSAWRLHFLDEDYEERRNLVAAMRKFIATNGSTDKIELINTVTQKIAAKRADGTIQTRRKIYG